MYHFSLFLGERFLQKYVFQQETILVGRHEEADICIANPAISRQHARIEIRNGVCFIVDLGAVNGVVFRSQPVKEHRFSPGDVVSLGKYSIRFDGESTKTSGTTTTPQRPAGAQTTQPMSQFDFEQFTIAVANADTAKVLPTQLVVTYPDGYQNTLVVYSQTVVIGGSSKADITLSTWFAPAICARISPGPSGDLQLQCEKKRPKLLLNGAKTTRAVLRHGDIIEVGGIEIVIKRASPDRR